MSGIKVSEFQLREERRRQLEAEQRLRDVTQEVGALAQRLRDMVAAASDGDRKTFDCEIGAAESWLGAMVGTGAGTASSTEQTQARAASLGIKVKDGHALVRKLGDAFSTRKDEMGRDAERQITAAEVVVASNEELVSLWAPEHAAAWREELQSLRTRLAGDDLRDLAAAAAALAGRVQVRAKECRAREAKHQKRMFVIDQLRQVCANMGFREVAAQWNESDRGSPVVLLVDTGNRGEIRFHVSLESIESHAGEEDRQFCLSEFAKLSENLAQLDVDTKWKDETGTPLPIDRAWNERSEPTPKDRSQQN